MAPSISEREKSRAVRWGLIKRPANAYTSPYFCPLHENRTERFEATAEPDVAANLRAAGQQSHLPLSESEGRLRFNLGTHEMTVSCIKSSANPRSVD